MTALAFTVVVTVLVWKFVLGPLSRKLETFRGIRAVRPPGFARPITEWDRLQRRKRWRGRRRKAWAIITTTFGVLLSIALAVGFIVPWVEWLTGLLW